MASWTRHGSVRLQKYTSGSKQQLDQYGLRCHQQVPCWPTRCLAALLPPAARAELQFLSLPDLAASPGGSVPVISAHTQINAWFLEKAQQGCAQASQDTTLLALTQPCASPLSSLQMPAVSSLMLQTRAHSSEGLRKKSRDTAQPPCQGGSEGLAPLRGCRAKKPARGQEGKP